MDKIKYEAITAQGLNDFKYFKVSNALLTDPAYKQVSFDGAIMYGLLRDRMDLSVKNTDRFTDSLGRVYIEYTVKELCQTLRFSESKCKRVLKNLVDSDLVHIERGFEGYAVKNRVYVKAILTAPSRDGFYTEETVTSTDGYIPVPFLLLADDDLKDLSVYAKGLYAALLNRRALSENNDKYIDKNGIPFVMYSIAEVMQKFGVATGKAVKMFKDLEECGLISRVSLNDVKVIEKPSDKDFKNLKAIYINDFRRKHGCNYDATSCDNKASDVNMEKTSQYESCDSLHEKNEPININEVEEKVEEAIENRGSESKHLGVQNRNIYGFKTETFRGSESKHLGVQNRNIYGFKTEIFRGSKSKPIRLNINNTNNNITNTKNTNSNQSNLNLTKREETVAPENKGAMLVDNDKTILTSEIDIADESYNTVKKPYGKRGNVMLTDAEYDRLDNTYLHHDKLIEKVSLIFANKRTLPKDHLAYCEKIALEDDFIMLDDLRAVKSRAKAEPLVADVATKSSYQLATSRLEEMRRRIRELTSMAECK